MRRKKSETSENKWKLETEKQLFIIYHCLESEKGRKYQENTIYSAIHHRIQRTTRIARSSRIRSNGEEFQNDFRRLRLAGA